MNDLAIRDRLVDRTGILEMFKHKTVKNSSECELFTKTYNRWDIE